jgi:hypothetical protein
MKYSKWIGLVAAVLVIVSCYMVWIDVPSVSLEIGGMHSSGKQNYGRPGLLNLIMAVMAILFFLLPYIFAKRANIFIGAFNIAWSMRNFILLSKCYGGDCPIRKTGLYLLMGASLVLMVMTFLPDLEIGQNPPVEKQGPPGT